MRKEEKLICDFCDKPITTLEVIEVEYVEEDLTKYLQVNDDEKTRIYFHLRPKEYSKRGCYGLWLKKTNYKIVPHGVKKTLVDNLS